MPQRWNERLYDSPPPYLKIKGGRFRRHSSLAGPPGYLPYNLFDSMPLSYYGSTPQDPAVIVGSCPACRIGRLEYEYSYFSLFCVCCMPFAFGRHRKCDNCGAYFK